jgi:hypothetical protein
MSRGQFLGGAAVVALAYTAANAIDARLADPHRAMCMMSSASAIFVNVPAAIAFALLLLGGLPLAVFGLLYECRWMGVASAYRRYLRVPYAVLMFQIVSVAVTGLVLGLGYVAGPFPYVFVGWPDVLVPTYLAAQLLAGIAAVPVWRRHMSSTFAYGIKPSDFSRPSST